MAEHLNAFTQNCAPPASYAYDPFGNVKKTPGSIDQPFQFSTKQYDPQTGLSYYGYRFYSPQLGRWINRDPLGEAGGVNLYLMVGNDPVNWVDPFGLEREWAEFYDIDPTPSEESLKAAECYLKCMGVPSLNAIGEELVFILGSLWIEEHYRAPNLAKYKGTMSKKVPVKNIWHKYEPKLSTLSQGMLVYKSMDCIRQCKVCK